MITLRDLELCASFAREVEDIRERIARLRAAAEGMRGRAMEENGVVAPGADADRLARAMADIDALERRALLKFGVYTGHVAAVELALDAVPDADQRRILRMRYIDGMLWEDIGERTHYNERWCKELRRRGLNFLGI